MKRTIHLKDIALKEPKGLIRKDSLIIKNFIDTITKEIYSHKDLKLIFICGPSASGKTTFASLLEKKLDSINMESHILSLDDFFRDRKDLPYIKEGIRDFDSIHALDNDLVKKCFNDLLTFNQANIPQFDFLRGARMEEFRKLNIENNDVVIVEGIHSFNPLIQGELSKKNFINIYIEPMTDIIIDEDMTLTSKNIRLIRRLIRDYYTRGHNLDVTLRQWKYVRESEDRNIYPYTNKAHFTIDTFHEYEIMVYKSILYPMLDKENERTQVLFRALENVSSLSPDLVPIDSIIKEFTKF